MQSPVQLESAAPVRSWGSGSSSWTYPEIQNTWANRGYAECATGTTQSPIDLSNVSSPPEKKVTLTVPDLLFMPVKLDKNNNFSFSIPRQMDPRYIVVDGSSWEMQEFHFHVPGENTIPRSLDLPLSSTPQMELHIKTKLRTQRETYAVFAVLLLETASPPPDAYGWWLTPIFKLLDDKAPGRFTLKSPTSSPVTKWGPLNFFENTPFFAFPAPKPHRLVRPSANGSS